MIRIEHDRDNYLVCRVSGTLTRTDYDAAIPELENELELHERPLRMMIVLEDFHGWEIGALWQELKFDMKHGSDFGRIAVLGDSTLEEWGTLLSKPFFGSEMKYFDLNDRDKARVWLSEGRAATPRSASAS